MLTLQRAAIHAVRFGALQAAQGLGGRAQDGQAPVDLNIRAFIQLINQGDYLAAAAKIREDNVLPAITGRVCPRAWKTTPVVRNSIQGQGQAWCWTV